jgi:outer membrane immunogenic protein
MMLAHCWRAGPGVLLEFIMRLVVAAAAVAALGSAVPAMAQDQGTSSSYTGVYGNLGWSGVNAQGSWTHSITGRVGGRFGRFVGVEGEVSGGLSTDHHVTGTTNVGVKQTLAGAAYGVGFLPLGSNFDLLARVGYGASRFNVEPAGLASYHVSEHGIRYGAGAQYFFDGRNGIRADWTRHDLNNFKDAPGLFPGDRKADVWSVSFAHKF